jgi:signal peptidase I
MQPAILPGDYVLVNKIVYGPRLIDLYRLIFFQDADYIRLKGYGKVKKGDIIVFNYPQFNYLKDSVSFIYGTPLVKRCQRMPGDSLLIGQNRSEMIELNNIRYSHQYDTTLLWDVDYYGLLYIPRKGDTIPLTKENLKHYNDVLLYENIGLHIQNDSAFINGTYYSKHCFKYNYYFMLGDNFYQSKDSRFWGFLPETHIIGKATMVLFSLDPGKPWYKKLRWHRFFKKIV